MPIGLLIFFMMTNFVISTASASESLKYQCVNAESRTPVELVIEVENGLAMILIGPVNSLTRGMLVNQSTLAPLLSNNFRAMNRRILRNEEGWSAEFRADGVMPARGFGLTLSNDRGVLQLSNCMFRAR